MRFPCGERHQLESGAHTHNTVLYDAARVGDANMARLLIEHGARIDSMAFIKAVGDSNFDLVELFINAAPEHVQFALRFAVRTGDLEIARLLMRQGADPSKLRKGWWNDATDDMYELLVMNGAEDFGAPDGQV